MLPEGIHQRSVLLKQSPTPEIINILLQHLPGPVSRFKTQMLILLRQTCQLIQMTKAVLLVFNARLNIHRNCHVNEDSSALLDNSRLPSLFCQCVMRTGCGTDNHIHLVGQSITVCIGNLHIFFCLLMSRSMAIRQSIRSQNRFFSRFQLSGSSI